MQLTYREPLEELLPLLQVLDGLLERYLDVTKQINENESATASSNQQVVEGILKNELKLSPNEPEYLSLYSIELPSSRVHSNSRLGTLKSNFGLSAFDIDTIVIALAPELDRRYEKFYAYLQQDVRCHRLSVDLSLNLLCTNVAQKIQKRSHFAPDAPLLAGMLLKLKSPQQFFHPTLLNSEIILEPAVVRYILGETGLDDEIKEFSVLRSPSTDALKNSLPNQVKTSLNAIAEKRQEGPPLHLYVQSNDQLACDNLVDRLAHQTDHSVLRVDVILLVRETAYGLCLRRLFRDTWLQNAILYLQSVDLLYEEANIALWTGLVQSLSEQAVSVVMNGNQPWQSPQKQGLKVLQLTLPELNYAERGHQWRMQLADSALNINDATIVALTNQFRLTATQIERAIATAQISLQHGYSSESPQDALLDAVRRQCGQALDRLAQHIRPRYGWEDLVLPRLQAEQLREICIHMQQRHRVLETWGFDRKLSLGKGISALFSGPPGTGKTMAAEVVARSLHLDLYRIDLSQVVSKYIGETEKNLSQIFTAASRANAILLFDEADALFGKRTEIKDSHDRFANIEVGYLLQQIEAYEGLAILTTNLKNNLDNAFTRRLRFIIEFPLPSVRDRALIWQKIWPPELPLDPDIDWHHLASQFELTGGHIHNIALSAAFLAAHEDQEVKLHHIHRAIQREHQKLGKLLLDNTISVLP